MHYLTDWDTILTVLIREMSGMTGIEVDKRHDIFPTTIFIGGISIMCRIKKEFFKVEFQKGCFHGEKESHHAGKSVPK